VQEIHGGPVWGGLRRFYRPRKVTEQGPEEEEKKPAGRRNPGSISILFQKREMKAKLDLGGENDSPKEKALHARVSKEKGKMFKSILYNKTGKGEKG